MSDPAPVPSVSAPPPASVQLSLAPEVAWQPLPVAEWNLGAARHLLRRIGWTARSDAVAQVLQEGLTATLERLFPVKANPFPVPRTLAALATKSAEIQGRIAATRSSGAAKQELQKELNQDFQQAGQDLAVQWLRFAGRPENSVMEKWVFFLSDIYVVSEEKVRNPELIYAHQDLLRTAGLGSAPALAKAVSRSPAMVQYLDLDSSQKAAPNENFARELFELFLLGEGNYTEQDIKQSARAFTGYRQNAGVFRFVPNQHDPGPKTVFGVTAPMYGDDVIDLAFAQPAAGARMAHKLARFYLTDDPLPKAHLAALGDWWRAEGDYDLRRLAHRFFGSRLFFDASSRGNYLKSPVQYYLGLVQDLNLDVTPLPRRTVAPLRNMGQTLFRPPNVRGWVGGRNWINSGTLAARRHLVEMFFSPLPADANLNADEVIALNDARGAGFSRFSVGEQGLQEFAAQTPDWIADRLIADFLPMQVADDYRQAVRDFLVSGPVGPAGSRAALLPTRQRYQRLRTATMTLLESPEYQLC